MRNIIFFLFFSIASFAQNDYYLASNYYREGEFSKAISLYKKLYKKSPYNSSLLKKIINCHQELNQYQEVDDLLNAQLKKNAKRYYLYVEKGYNFAIQKQPEKALENYTIAIESINKKQNQSSIIGNFFKDNHLLDYALKAYNKGMEINSKSNFNFQIAAIHGEKGDFPKMFASYIDLIDKQKNYLATVQRYASKYITEDKENTNNILFKKALLRKSIKSPKNEWNTLLSWLFTQQKEYAKALTQNIALYRRDANYLPKINRLAKIAFDNKAYSASIKAWEFSLNNTTFLADKLKADEYLLSIAIAMKEKEIDAKFAKVFEKYGIQKSSLNLQVSYANYLTFSQDNPEKAIDVLENALQFNLNKFEQAKVKLILGDILVFTGQHHKALLYFSQVQTKLKNHVLAQEARYKVARTSYFIGDFTWAEAQLKILKGSTTQLIANDALDIFLIISVNKTKDSIPIGLKAFANAHLLAYQNKTQAAIDSLGQITKNFKGKKIEDIALFKQAELFHKQKEYQKSEANYLKIIALNKDGLLRDDATFKVAELYENKLNAPKKASEYYQKVIFEHASSIYLVEARKKYRKLRGDSIN